MNKALLLTVCVAAIGLAGPAYADPGIATGNDAQFLSTLTGAGLQHRAGDQVTVSAGRAVCQLMDAGLSPMDTVTAVQTTNPGFTLQEAGQFAAIASANYCPEHI